MIIKTIEIEKFRTIKKSKIELKNIMAIVGENNAGKTTILRAINAVMNFKMEEKFFDDKTHQYSIRNNTYITIVFSDIPQKERYINKLFNNELIIKFSYSYSDKKRKYQYKFGGNFVSLDDSFIEEMKEDISFVYITSERTNQDITWSESSLIKELIMDYFAKQTEKRDMISANIQKVTNKIHSNVLTKLEKDVNQLFLKDLYGDLKIDFSDQITYSILLDQINVYLDLNNNKLQLKEWGSGTKSLAIIAMYRTKAILHNANIVLGIEEPEINLHPQAQRRFIKFLKNNMNECETQAIFTTHSTVLIDELKHDEIAIVRQMKDISKSERTFYSSVFQIKSNFWEINDLNEYKYYQFFNFKNSDFFFSKYIIVCESKNDSQVFEYLLSKKLPNKMLDISFINMDGIKNIKYPYYLFKELEIPYCIITDFDYFFPYLNEDLDNSRDCNGFPLYKNIMKNDCIIKKDFDISIVNLFESKASKYYEFAKELRKYNLYSLRYCLEIDLIGSQDAQKYYYNVLQIPENNRNTNYVLTHCKGALKEIEKLMSALESIPLKNLPKSYLYICNEIANDIKNKLN